MVHASCHCGAVQLEIARKPRTLTECNCEICRRYAAQWAYYSRSAVRIICDDGALASYTGRIKTFRYYHCKTCGCVTHYQRVNTTNDDRMAVNARLMNLEDTSNVRLRTLDVRRPEASR